MANKTFIPQMARLYLAAVGTVAPDGPTVALGTGWHNVGLFTPDSLNWATDPSFEQVRAHQSRYPVRTFQTQDAATIEVDLLEWTEEAFRAVFGGGSVEEITPQGGGTAYWKFTPPAVGGRDQTAALVELGDGARKWRRVVPLCETNSGVTQSFNSTQASTLPLRLAIVGSDIGDPWYDLTNDAGFKTAA